MPEPLKRSFFVLGEDIIHYKRKDMHDFNSTKVCVLKDVASAVKWLKEKINEEKNIDGRMREERICHWIDKAFANITHSTNNGKKKRL